MSPLEVAARIALALIAMAGAVFGIFWIVRPRKRP